MDMPNLGDRVMRGPDFFDNVSDESDSKYGTVVIDAGFLPGTFCVLWDNGYLRRHDCKPGGKREAIVVHDAPAAPATKVAEPWPIPGTIVTRGPDWKWGDQDGGPGQYGFVLPGNASTAWIYVCWCNGKKNSYRWDTKGKYDVKAVEAAGDIPWSVAARKLINPPIPGNTVRRGPDWSWGDQDGGAGNLGTVIGGVTTAGAVRVKWWKNSHVNDYNWGSNDRIDLEIVSPSPPIPSDICILPPIPPIGTRVRCTISDSFGTIIEANTTSGMIPVLWDTGSIGCSSWGLDGKIDLEITTKPKPKFSALKFGPVPPVGTIVQRGPDWEWNDEDGGEGKRGKVSGNAPGWVRVQWDNKRERTYKWGAAGKLEIMVVNDGRKIRPFTAAHPKLEDSITTPLLTKKMV